MAKFQNYAETYLMHEGGAVKHPNDRGGATKFGITIGTLQSINMDVTGDGQVTEDDVWALTEDQALNIIKEHFWKPSRINMINSQEVAEAVFDHMVNAGISRGARVLQRAVNRLIDEPIAVDGVIGPSTAQAANAISPSDLMEKVLKERKKYYRRLVRQDPSQEEFLAGWLNRVNWFWEKKFHRAAA